MTKHYIGLSTDYRTNKWRITCDCGRTFEPATTMYSTQEVECPKCKKIEIIDYNEDEK